MADKKRISKKTLEDTGKSYLVQKHQHQAVEGVTVKMRQGLDDLSVINDNNLSELDALLAQSEALLKGRGITADDIDYNEVDTSELDAVLTLTETEKAAIKKYDFGSIESITCTNDISWQEYLSNIDKYAETYHIDLTVDPFKELMTPDDYEELAKRVKEDYTLKKAQCDKYDYIIAATSGVVCGLIDAFFVGMPKTSKLGNFTKEKTDDLVKVFAKANGWKPSLKAKSETASAIGFLERKYSVPYDAQDAKRLGLYDSDLSMSAYNHHLKSLGHSPDLLGLFFSLLDQFTNTTSLMSDGQFIRIQNEDNHFRLQGSNFIAKLFCGFCNWIGHIMSDIAGASGTAGHGRRGTGVPIPFFNLFQMCDFGSFNVKRDQKTLAELSTRMFQEGYDARHGAAMAIPVFLNEIIIRVSFTVKRRFYHRKTWKESMPFGSQPELRRMLVVGHGCLCLVDGIDAAIRSAKSGPAFILDFALHLNLVAWSKFALSGFREVLIIMNKATLDMEALNRDLDIEWKKLSA